MERKELNTFLPITPSIKETKANGWIEIFQCTETMQKLSKFISLYYVTIIVFDHI